MATLTVGDLTPRLQYTAAAGQTAFTYNFPIFQNSDLKVYVGSTLQTLTTNYTVSGAGTSGGGTVTFTSGRSAGDIVTIYRDMPVQRTTDYQANGDLLAENLNDDLDKLTMMVQQNEYNLGLTLRADQFDETANLTIPNKATRANSYLKFDTNGAPVTVTDDQLVAGLAGAVIGANYITNNATGDGTTVNFTLSSAPGSKGNLQIYIDGVYQNKATFSLAGTTVTFTEAPPLNASVEFIIGYSIGSTSGDATGIDFTQQGTGAVSRTVANKLYEFVSVKDFGAVGDGVTDDTAAINSALASSKMLFIPEGTYLTTGGHVVTDQKIIGANRNNTIIKKISGTNVIFSLTDSSGFSGSISELTIDGNNLDGHGIFVGATIQIDNYEGIVEKLIIKNIGGTVTTTNITNVTGTGPGTITTATAHNLSPFDVVRIKGVQGVDTSNNASIPTFTNAGSGGVDGTYTNVQLVYVSGQTAATYPTCTVVVSGGVVSSVSAITNPTGVALGNPMTLTANSGDIGGVTGFECICIPNGSYERSVVNCTTQALTASGSSLTIFAPNSSGYTAYVSGGTVEKCSYAVCIGLQGSSGNFVRNRMFRDIQFFNNYGHIYVGYSRYVVFDNMDMYGDMRGGYGMFIAEGTQDITLVNSYMESGVGTCKKGCRELTFDNVSVRLLPGSTWDAPWLYSEGCNAASSAAGSEVAGLYVHNVTVNRAAIGSDDKAIIFTNAYQATISRVFYGQSATVNSVYFMRDCGCIDLRVVDLVVDGAESALTWNLFHPASGYSGSRQTIENIDGTQGAVGTITLPQSNAPGTSSPFVRVADTNCNVDIKNVRSKYTTYFVQNVMGNVDFANASSAKGNVLINCSGTVTDPNNTISLGANGTRIRVNPQQVFADNATALAGGMLAGESYRTATGDVKVVY